MLKDIELAKISSIINNISIAVPVAYGLIGKRIAETALFTAPLLFVQETEQLSCPRTQHALEMIAIYLYYC